MVTGIYSKTVHSHISNQTILYWQEQSNLRKFSSFDIMLLDKFRVSSLWRWSKFSIFLIRFWCKNLSTCSTVYIKHQHEYSLQYHTPHPTHAHMHTHTHSTHTHLTGIWVQSGSLVHWSLKCRCSLAIGKSIQCTLQDSLCKRNLQWKRRSIVVKWIEWLIIQMAG